MHCREYKDMGEKLWSGELSNKLKYYIVPKPGFSKAFACLAVKYGGSDVRFEKDGEWLDTPAGIAHFLEHKMFDMPDGENALSVLAANGASPNAFTANGMTAYYFECTDKFYENFEMLLKFVSTPYYTQESVDKEQGIIGQEIMMVEDRPGHRRYNELMRCLYRENPIRESIAGSIESIARISADTLYSCYNTFYVPANMTLCVCGDVDAGKVIEAAERILPKEAGNGSIRRDYGAPDDSGKCADISRVKMEVAAPLFLMGTKLPCPEDGAERRRLVLVSEIVQRIMAGTSSPLYSRLYSCGLINKTFSSGTDEFPGGLTLLFAGESSEPEKVRDEILAEAKRLSREGIDESYFLRIKKSIMGDVLRSFDMPEEICCQMAYAHFGSYDIFEDLNVLSGITMDEVLSFIAEKVVESNTAMAVVENK